MWKIQQSYLKMDLIPSLEAQVYGTYKVVTFGFHLDLGKKGNFFFIFLKAKIKCGQLFSLVECPVIERKSISTSDCLCKHQIVSINL